MGVLADYVQREGHCRVPADHLENGFRLGSWVVNSNADKEIIPLIRRQRLDELGFVWEPWEEDWNEGFSYLQSHKEREGHCRVPLGHRENEYKLGRWVNKQRTRKESMPIDRQARLEALGFVWDTLSDHWEERVSAILRIQRLRGSLSCSCALCEKWLSPWFMGS